MQELASMPAEIRAKHVKNNLAAIAEMSSAEDCARIHAAMGADTVKTIEDAPRTAWLDVEHDIRLAEAVAKVSGLDGDRLRARTALRISMDDSILRPLVEGVTRVFGLSPTAVLRVAGRGWGAVYRNAGSVKVHNEGDSHVRLAYTNIAPEIITREVYMMSIAGALLAMFDLCKVQGKVELEDVSLERRRADFHFRW